MGPRSFHSRLYTYKYQIVRQQDRSGGTALRRPDGASSEINGSTLKSKLELTGFDVLNWVWSNSPPGMTLKKEYSVPMNPLD